MNIITGHRQVDVKIFFVCGDVPDGANPHKHAHTHKYTHTHAHTQIHTHTHLQERGKHMVK